MKLTLIVINIVNFRVKLLLNFKINLLFSTSTKMIKISNNFESLFLKKEFFTLIIFSEELKKLNWLRDFSRFLIFIDLILNSEIIVKVLKQSSKISKNLLMVKNKIFRGKFQNNQKRNLMRILLRSKLPINKNYKKIISFFCYLIFDFNHF